MNIYLIRHGEAVAKEIDPMQPLSEAGIRSVQKIAEFLAKTEIKLQQIFHSGKPRAQQTAAIIAKKINFQGLFEKKMGLEPMDDVVAFADQIESWDKDTLLAGHLPFLGKLLDLLIIKGKTNTQHINNNIDNTVVDFEPATIVCLESMQRGEWSIKWVVKPELTEY